MLILKSPSSFDSITDPDILKLVKLRHSQLGDEMFGSVIIVEIGDTVEDIKNEIGFCILTNLFDDISYPDPDFVPSCEALEDHGDFYEMLFIFGDGHQDRTNASMSVVKMAMTEKCRRTSWVSQSVSMRTAIYHSAPRVSSPTPVLSITIG